MRVKKAVENKVEAGVAERAQLSKCPLQDVPNDGKHPDLFDPKIVADRRTPPDFPTYNMGEPLVDLTKAAALAAELEDQEYIAKFVRGA